MVLCIERISLENLFECKVAQLLQKLPAKNMTNRSASHTTSESAYKKKPTVVPKKHF